MDLLLLYTLRHTAPSSVSVLYRPVSPRLHVHRGERLGPFAHPLHLLGRSMDVVSCTTKLSCKCNVAYGAAAESDRRLALISAFLEKERKKSHRQRRTAAWSSLSV